MLGYTLTRQQQHTQCCICESWLPWTSLLLESHLRDKHKMTVAEYARVNAAKILRQMESTGNTADAIAPKPVAATKSAKKPVSEWFDQKDAAYRCQGLNSIHLKMSRKSL